MGPRAATAWLGMLGLCCLAMGPGCALWTRDACDTNADCVLGRQCVAGRCQTGGASPADAGVGLSSGGSGTPSSGASASSASSASSALSQASSSNGASASSATTASGSSGVASTSQTSSSATSGHSSSGPPEVCPRPNLLALVRSNDGGSTIRGEIRRWSLASGTPVVCPTLTGGGRLDPRESVLMFLAPDTLVVGTQGELRFFSLSQDVLTWEYPQPGGEGGLPVSAFTVMGPAGREVVGVGCTAASGDPDLDFLDVLDPTTQLRLNHWRLDQNPLLLGTSVLSMARHPVTTGSILYTNNNDATLRSAVLPFNNANVLPGSYTTGISTVGNARNLQTTQPVTGATRVLYSFRGAGGALGLKVWSDSGSGPLVQPAFSCALSQCSGGDVLDAVVDPVAADHAFIVCQDVNDANTAHLMRVGPANACEPVLLDDALPTLSFVARLALVP